MVVEELHERRATAAMQQFANGGLEARGEPRPRTPVWRTARGVPIEWFDADYLPISAGKAGGHADMYVALARRLSALGHDARVKRDKKGRIQTPPLQLILAAARTVTELSKTKKGAKRYAAFVRGVIHEIRGTASRALDGRLSDEELEYLAHKKGFKEMHVDDKDKIRQGLRGHFMAYLPAPNEPFQEGLVERKVKDFRDDEDDIHRLATSIVKAFDKVYIRKNAVRVKREMTKSERKGAKKESDRARVASAIKKERDRADANSSAPQIPEALREARHAAKSKSVSLRQLRQGREKDARREMRLLMSGDIESNPGPRCTFCGLDHTSVQCPWHELTMGVRRHLPSGETMVDGVWDSAEGKYVLYWAPSPGTCRQCGCRHCGGCPLRAFTTWLQSSGLHIDPAHCTVSHGSRMSMLCPATTHPQRSTSVVEGSPAYDNDGDDRSATASAVTEPVGVGVATRSVSASSSPVSRCSGRYSADGAVGRFGRRRSMGGDELGFRDLGMGSEPPPPGRVDIGHGDALPLGLRGLLAPERPGIHPALVGNPIGALPAQRPGRADLGVPHGRSADLDDVASTESSDGSSSSSSPYSRRWSGSFHGRHDSRASSEALSETAPKIKPCEFVVGQRPLPDFDAPLEDNAGHPDPNAPKHDNPPPLSGAISYGPREHIWDDFLSHDVVDPVVGGTKSSCASVPFGLTELTRPISGWRAKIIRFVDDHAVAITSNRLLAATGANVAGCVMLGLGAIGWHERLINPFVHGSVTTALLRLAGEAIRSIPRQLTSLIASDPVCHFVRQSLATITIAATRVTATGATATTHGIVSSRSGGLLNAAAGLLGIAATTLIAAEAENVATRTAAELAVAEARAARYRLLRRVVDGVVHLPRTVRAFVASDACLPTCAGALGVSTAICATLVTARVVHWALERRISRLHALVRLQKDVVVITEHRVTGRRNVPPLAARMFAAGLLGYRTCDVPRVATYAHMLFTRFSDGKIVLQRPLEYNYTAALNFFQQYPRAAEALLHSDTDDFRSLVVQYCTDNPHLAVADGSEEYYNTAMAVLAWSRCVAYQNFARRLAPAAPPS